MEPSSASPGRHYLGCFELFLRSLTPPIRFQTYIFRSQTYIFTLSDVFVYVSGRIRLRYFEIFLGFRPDRCSK